MELALPCLMVPRVTQNACFLPLTHTKKPLLEIYCDMTSGIRASLDTQMEKWKEERAD